MPIPLAVPLSAAVAICMFEQILNRELTPPHRPTRGVAGPLKERACLEDEAGSHKEPARDAGVGAGGLAAWGAAGLVIFRLTKQVNQKLPAL